MVVGREEDLAVPSTPLSVWPSLKREREGGRKGGKEGGREGGRGRGKGKKRPKTALPMYIHETFVFLHVHVRMCTSTRYSAIHVYVVMYVHTYAWHCTLDFSCLLYFLQREEVDKVEAASSKFDDFWFQSELIYIFTFRIIHVHFLSR